MALPLAEPEKVRRRPDRGALPVVAALTLLCVATKINHKLAAVQGHREARRLVEVLRDTLRGMEPEAGHYLERLAQLAFGGVEAVAA